MPTLRGAGGGCVEAQAKVNLRLRILTREAGGYHQIETLFLRLALADTVRVRLTAGERTLDAQGLDGRTTLGPGDQNLAWRAADAYAGEAGWPAGFAIELVKRIPVGGGLGGGSADAGGVLRVLDALAPRPMPATQMLRIAASLGADVPFLTTEHPYALAWGRGERLLPLSPPPARDVVLVVPPFGVNTAEAYRWLAASREASGAGPEAAVLDADALTDWARLEPLATNDFEAVVAVRHPEIAAIVRALGSAGCRPALMSGSGSVVFGVLPEPLGTEATLVGDPALGGRRIITTTAVTVAPVTPSAN